MTGIEPAFQAWEACVLPLNYIRTWDYLHYSKNTLPLQSLYTRRSILKIKNALFTEGSRVREPSQTVEKPLLNLHLGEAFP